MADTAVLIALVGVGGTLAGTSLGALINARSSSRLEDRREQAEAATRWREGRAAARVIRMELLIASANLNMMLEHNTWSPLSDSPFPVEGWRGHRAQLALALDDAEAWNSIEVAMTAVVRLGAMVDTVERGPLSSENKASLEGLSEYLVHAEERLEPLSEQSSPA